VSVSPVRVACIFLLLACMASGPVYAEGGLKTLTVSFARAKATVTAEVADTEETRAKGLMFRRALDKKSGMLFIFKEVAPHSFWMQNTLIPLDIIFLDEKKRVVDALGMVPCLERNPAGCPVYTPRAAARYALEVNAGFLKEFGIKIGDLAVFGR